MGAGEVGDGGVDAPAEVLEDHFGGAEDEIGDWREGCGGYLVSIKWRYGQRKVLSFYQFAPLWGLAKVVGFRRRGFNFGVSFSKISI